jgi:2,3-bisphosphoglycerate-independent phosphoglycerate mutase
MKRDAGCVAHAAADPLKDGLPLLRSAALDDSDEAAHTAAVVNQVRCRATRDKQTARVAHGAAQACDAIRAVLAAHPLNAERVAEGRAPATALLLRGPGERLREQSFFDRHGCAIHAPLH